MILWKTLLGLATFAAAISGCAPTVAEAAPIQIKDAAIPKDAQFLVVGGFS